MSAAATHSLEVRVIDEPSLVVEPTMLTAYPFDPLSIATTNNGCLFGKRAHRSLKGDLIDIDNVEASLERFMYIPEIVEEYEAPTPGQRKRIKKKQNSFNYDSSSRCFDEFGSPNCRRRISLAQDSPIESRSSYHHRRNNSTPRSFKSAASNSTNTSKDSIAKLIDSTDSLFLAEQGKLLEKWNRQVVLKTPNRRISNRRRPSPRSSSSKHTETYVMGSPRELSSPSHIGLRNSFTLKPRDSLSLGRSFAPRSHKVSLRRPTNTVVTPVPIVAARPHPAEEHYAPCASCCRWIQVDDPNSEVHYCGQCACCTSNNNSNHNHNNSAASTSSFLHSSSNFSFSSTLAVAQSPKTVKA